MARPRPEFVMPLAALGVLLAIGIPALRRGEGGVGWTCVGAAAAVVVWLVVVLLRSRG